MDKNIQSRGRPRVIADPVVTTVFVSRQEKEKISKTGKSYSSFVREAIREKIAREIDGVAISSA